MVVRGEPGDHGKDTEECYLPKRRPWQQSWPERGRAEDSLEGKISRIL